MNDWRKRLDESFPDTVDVEGLVPGAVAAMVAMLRSSAYAGATLTQCRTDPSRPGTTVLFAEVEVPIGQRPPVNDIRHAEPVAFYYPGQGVEPHAYPLREDFPENLPHMNMSWSGEPRSLCLFEMPSEEVLRIATPHVMVERVRWWLAETAHGRLHGVNQPLDPVFANSGQVVILPPAGQLDPSAGALAAVRIDDKEGAPVFVVPLSTASEAERHHYSAVAVTTGPAGHRGIRRLPRSLGELVDIYAELGINLTTPLRTAFRRWASLPDVDTMLTRPCLLIVSTPIEREEGVVERIDTKTFHTGVRPTRQTVEALRALVVAGGNVSSPFPDEAPDVVAMGLIGVSTLDVHVAMDRRLARAASGRDGVDGDDRATTLVGAGALGSQLALCAARMGIGRWTIVDPDYLMPHNLGRHALLARHVGAAKADALAHEIRQLLGPAAATSVVDPVEAEASASALAGVDLVIDASASVPVARWLALEAGHAARTVSVFLNPKGDDLVILKEGQGRTPRLDQVEMSFHWLLATDRRLDGHFDLTLEGLHPSGGCRSPSLRMPQSRIGALASVAVDRVFDADPADGVIEVWRSSPDGIAVIRSTPSPYRKVSIAGHAGSISVEAVEAMTSARRKAGACETGGILVGSWDRARKAFYVVAALDAPTDSVASRTGFVRGCAGVYQTLEDVERRTAANLTYVGEWHSHPPGHGTAPSGDDQVLLEWISDVLAFSDVPPCMAIVGNDGVRIVVGRHDRYEIIRQSRL